MPPKTTSKTRRAEVRRSMRGGQPTWRQRLWRRPVLWAVVFGLTFMMLAGMVVVEARQHPPYRINELVDRSVVTRVKFDWLDAKGTEFEQARAREKTPRIYRRNQTLLEALRQRLVSLPTVVAAAPDVRQLADRTAREFGITEATFATLKNELKPYEDQGQPTQVWTGMVNKFIEELSWRPVLTPKRYAEEKQSIANQLVLMTEGRPARPVGTALLLSLGDIDQLRNGLESYTSGMGPTVRNCIVHYLTTTNQPTYLLDEQATEVAQDAAASGVRVTETYQPEAGNAVLVPAGTRMDREKYQLLQQEQRAYLASLPAWRYIMSVYGPMGLVLLVIGGLVAAVAAKQPRIGENPLRGLALTALLLGALVWAWLWSSASVGYIDTGAAVFTVLLVAAIIAIAYDRMFAVIIGALQAVLTAVALNMSFGAFLAIAVGVVVAVAQLRDVRQRGKLIRVGFVTGLAVAMGLATARLTEMNQVDGLFGAIAQEALVMGFLPALGVGFFVLGVLPFIERMFKVTTAMTLLELCDVNQPLLRRLAQAAPGTYNHSLTLASMAEAAAEAVGANGLLARVGAYYHDIGKVNKPQYFIENQGGGPNKHEKLSPAMSLLIIVGHVKDGIEMAREYNLPPVLHHFIESHHGTTLVEYFYHAARKQVPLDEAPSEVEFRYPGPKPATKEAAILLLCDSTEAAMRTMSDPNPGRIEQFVNTMANKRLMDGQFDDCNLTLEELKRIEESITKTLCGIYHGRIAYPKKAEKSEQAQPAGEQAASADRAAG